MTTEPEVKEKPLATEKKVKEKPVIRKPVIAFYKNTDKSGWQMFPQVCLNEEIAKHRIDALCDPAKVSFLEVPEDLQNS